MCTYIRFLHFDPCNCWPKLTFDLILQDQANHVAIGLKVWYEFMFLPKGFKSNCFKIKWLYCGLQLLFTHIYRPHTIELQNKTKKKTTYSISKGVGSKGFILIKFFHQMFSNIGESNRLIWGELQFQVHDFGWIQRFVTLQHIHFYLRSPLLCVGSEPHHSPDDNTWKQKSENY